MHKEVHMSQKTTVSFALVSQMMGASLLSMPYIFSQLGVVLVVLSFSLIFVIVIILLAQFTEAIHYSGAMSYRDATKKICGNKACQLLNICLIVSYYGFCTGYIIISSRSAYSFIKNTFSTGDFNIIWVKIVISFFIVFPLTLVSKMSILAKVSSISSLIIFVTVISIATIFFIRFSKQSICGNGSYHINILPEQSPGQAVLLFLMYIPSIQSNFGSYNAIPSLLNSVQGPAIFKKQTVKISAWIAATFGTIFYLCVGYMGAIMFGTKISNNIFVNIGECNFIYFNILGLLYGLVVIISFPLVIFPIKETLLAQYGMSINDKKGQLWALLISSLFVVFSFALAAVYENIVVIFAIFASLSGFVYVFYLPFIFSLKLPQLRSQNQHADAENDAMHVVDPLMVPILAHIMPVERARALTIRMFGHDRKSFGEVHPRTPSIFQDAINCSCDFGSGMHLSHEQWTEQSECYA
uniref:Amino acid transporter family protein n=1 Tax=Spironucleus salmonicida TaxID=348837 RepID=V6LZ47_9EUKA|eukprot:EST49553.1 Amino acid transporter family protein [Spironucleus salmonicida]